ncbi:MAG TPA: hypothetical protein VGD79_13865 [Thermoanaerobaculia bacterium]|jgi:hypothetical protein
MTSFATDRRAVVLLSLLIVIGAGLLSIPWFLTPPAYLDLALRDSAFGADLSASQVLVTDETTGKTMTAAIHKVGDAFIARIGRINSGKGAYRAQITGYRPGTARIDAAALQNVRAPLDLHPTFGRLEITPVNATRRDETIPATVKQGARVVTPAPQRTIVVDLPPGKHRFSADATGYCPSDREFEVSEAKLTKVVLPLSPDLRDDEIARFVLGWRNEPRDLDSHLRKSDAVGFPHPAHLYWSQKTGSFPGGGVFARLDVDELYPGRYETVTVRANAMGEYRYFVHLFAGIGTINDADAMVQIYTRGCRVRTFTPPPQCTQNVWNVITLRYDGGNVDLVELGNCEAAYGRPVIK